MAQFLHVVLASQLVALLLLLSAMPGRALRCTPSTTDDLSPWQLVLSEKLSQLHQECFEKHTALTQTIQQFPALLGPDAVSEITYAAQVAWNLSLDEAHDRAQSILAPGPHHFVGARMTCILSWSFVDESLWRGLSDNKKLIRLARNMVTIGYRQDEPINARTFDLTSADGVLAAKIFFGDGQARGLAARLAFQFMLNTARASFHSMAGDPEVMRIMRGLVQIPSVFTTEGWGLRGRPTGGTGCAAKFQSCHAIAYACHGMGWHGPQELQADIGCIDRAN